MDKNHEPIQGPDGVCVTCGFLCKYSPTMVPLNHFEVNYHDRNTGRTESHIPDMSATRIQTELICYRRVADLIDEVKSLENEGGFIQRQEANKRIIWKDRNCGKWMKYTPGFSRAIFESSV